MIKGKIYENASEEWDESYYAEMEYHLTLECFEGIEGHVYGISDEIYDLRMLILATGKMVAEAEAEFREVKRTIDALEGTPESELLKVWSKRAFRQATLKSLLASCQSILEGGLLRLQSILVDRNQISAATIKNNSNGIYGLIKQFSGIGDPANRWELVEHFINLRNAILHSGGKFVKLKHNHNGFIAFVKGRYDLELKEINRLDGSKEYEISILKSTVISDYLDSIHKLFRGLVDAARALEG